MRLIHKKLIAFVFVALILFPLFGVGVGGNAYADTALSGYSGVLDDLQKDESFNPDEYPAIDGDYSLQVIQIAESTAGELFVYVYQPAANVKPLTATKINMSLTDDFAPYDYEDNVDNNPGGGENGSSGGGGGGGGSHGCSLALADMTDNQPSTYLYDLTLLNRNGVFAKYKVTNFCVLPDFVRYYNITSIYRNWDGDIDEPTGNDNTVNGVAFKVGLLYTVVTVDDKVRYYCKNVDTVEIRNPFVSFLRYFDGIEDFWAVSSSLGFSDLHYIAFDTDWKIDELKEVEVSFYTQSYSRKLWLDTYDYGEPIKQQPIILEGKKISNSADGFLGEKYEWAQIQTVEEFKKIDGLDKEAINGVGSCKWVVLFYVTDVEREIESGGKIIDNGTKVSEVTILRLKFMSDGDCYNLGAISDSQTGSDKPSNGLGDIGFWAYIWRCIVMLFNGTATLTEQIVAVVAIFIVVLALPILLTVLSLVFPAFGAVMKTILKGVWTGIKYLFIGLWYIISSPVRLIIWLIYKIKDGG